MPEFILDTSGSVRETRDNPPRFYPSPCLWTDLDAFTQGYVEALFFTENEPGTDRLTRLADLERWREGVERGEHKDIPGDYGFADLAPEALARIIEDCAKFQDDNGAALQTCDEQDAGPDGNSRLYPRQAGRDFWYTRNGHGCGFWDGDWPEPYATHLTAAAKTFGEADVYLGDDGKIHLS